MDRDRLFQDTHDIVDFAFDARVAAVFPDMIRRSVPAYETVVALTGLLAARHLGHAGRCYDLGCSLGASARAVLRCATVPDIAVFAIDSSAPMLARARALNADEPRIHWIEADIRTAEIAAADVVLMNYTLQFVPIEDRLPLLSRIRAGMRATGILLIAEKIRLDTPQLNSFHESLHEDWKRANGYTDAEIDAKRASLERTLLTETLAAHLERLAQAGFSRSDVWFRCLNWAAFAAWP
jgi:tRNA (cmo5U34)-methyltransferase